MKTKIIVIYETFLEYQENIKTYIYKQHEQKYMYIQIVFYQDKQL